MPFDWRSGAGVAFGTVGRNSGDVRDISAEETAVETGPVVATDSDARRPTSTADTAVAANRITTDSRASRRRWAGPLVVDVLALDRAAALADLAMFVTED